jgi:hypothetical protein
VRILLAGVLSCAFGAAACVSSTGRLEQNRFQHEIYPYALFYPPQGRAEAPLGPHYQLENFRSPDGRHRYQKAGDGYTIARSYAAETPPRRERELFYDLLLSRDTPPAAIWIRSAPLSEADRELPLETLAQRYLENAARLGRVAVPMGLEELPASNKRWGLRASSRLPCQLSKREALRIDFEVENARAARSLSEPSWKAGSVVLVRSGYLARGRYPVLLLVGRSSAPEDGAQLETDFERLLERLVLGDKGQGLAMKGGHTCQLGVGTNEQEMPPATPSARSAGEHTTPELEVPIIQEGAGGESAEPQLAPADAP